LERYVRRDRVLFPIHPDTWANDAVSAPLRAFPIGARLRVAPTASTRTVLVLDADPPHFVKLHCPRRISRFNRALRRRNIRNSVAVTCEMRDAGIAHLPDVLGVAFGPDPDAWGFLVRERRPRPVVTGR